MGVATIMETVALIVAMEDSVATIMAIVATIMETMETGVGETIQVSMLEAVEVEAMELAIVATIMAMVATIMEIVASIMGMEKMDGLVANANMIIKFYLPVNSLHYIIKQKK